MKGKVNISRSGKRAIFISLEDELSGVPVIEIKMTPADFALFVTGLSDQECDFKLYNNPFVGKKREYKNIAVTFPGEGWTITKEQVSEGVKPFVADGWMVFDVGQIGQDRYRVKGTQRTFTMTFIRFAEAPNDNP